MEVRVSADAPRPHDANHSASMRLTNEGREYECEDQRGLGVGDVGLIDSNI